MSPINSLGPEGNCLRCDERTTGSHCPLEFTTFSAGRPVRIEPD